jgi:hypothetical protein
MQGNGILRRLRSIAAALLGAEPKSPFVFDSGETNAALFGGRLNA